MCVCVCVCACVRVCVCVCVCVYCCIGTPMKQSPVTLYKVLHGYRYGDGEEGGAGIPLFSESAMNIINTYVSSSDSHSPS